MRCHVRSWAVKRDSHRIWLLLTTPSCKRGCNLAYSYMLTKALNLLDERIMSGFMVAVSYPTQCCSAKGRELASNVPPFE
jgi:hypothetical protein